MEMLCKDNISKFVVVLLGVDFMAKTQAWIKKEYSHNVLLWKQCGPQCVVVLLCSSPPCHGGNLHLRWLHLRSTLELPYKWVHPAPSRGSIIHPVNWITFKSKSKVGIHQLEVLKVMSCLSACTRLEDQLFNLYFSHICTAEENSTWLKWSYSNISLKKNCMPMCKEYKSGHMFVSITWS